MQPNNRSLPRAAILLCLAALLSSVAVRRASADTYKLTTVESSQQDSFYGIDAVGNYTVLRTGLIGPGKTCGSATNAAACYETFYATNSSSVFSTVAPTLTLDNGSACSPAVGAAFSGSGICNGAHFLFGGTYSFPDGTYLQGIWGGPQPDVFLDMLSNGFLSSGYINASGDAVYIDGLHDTLVFADDLTTDAAVTPEPSTLALLGTGSLALFGSLRRRLHRQ